MDINLTSQIFVYTDLASFPATGAAKTFYVADDTEKLYRWTGSAYVEVSAGSASTAWGTITGTLSNQTDLQTALNNKEPLKGSDDNYVTDAQLTVIGNTSGTNSGDNATNTTSNTYADGKVSQTITNGIIDKAPSEDAVFDALALKADLNSPTFTGNPSAPTPTTGDNDTSIATTAFVQNQIAESGAVSNRLFNYYNFI